MAERVQNPAMDDAQAQMDRVGWTRTQASVLGPGESRDYAAMAGPEVGNQYDADPMGEDYSAVTYRSSEPDTKYTTGPDGAGPQTPTAGTKAGG